MHREEQAELQRERERIIQQRKTEKMQRRRQRQARLQARRASREDDSSSVTTTTTTTTDKMPKTPAMTHQQKDTRARPSELELLHQHASTSNLECHYGSMTLLDLQTAEEDQDVTVNHHRHLYRQRPLTTFAPKQQKQDQQKHQARPNLWKESWHASTSILEETKETSNQNNSIINQKKVPVITMRAPAPMYLCRDSSLRSLNSSASRNSANSNNTAKSQHSNHHETTMNPKQSDSNHEKLQQQSRIPTTNRANHSNSSRSSKTWKPPLPLDTTTTTIRSSFTAPTPPTSTKTKRTARIRRVQIRYCFSTTLLVITTFPSLSPSPSPQ